MGTLSESVVLDDRAFQTAADALRALAARVENLRTDLSAMLDDLQTGFDTPAGRKFIQTCRKDLSEPILEQKLVIEHIGKTLEQAKQAYQPLYAEYDKLQKLIEKQV